MSMLSQSVVMPDFKKKKVDDEGPLSPKVDLNARSKVNDASSPEKRIPMVNKVAKEKLKLQEENKKLKAELEELK